MINAESYHVTEHERDVWAGIVTGHPETNASGLTEHEMLSYLVVAWNRDNPEDQVSGPDAFTVTRLTEWPEWMGIQPRHAG